MRFRVQVSKLRRAYRTDISTTKRRVFPCCGGWYRCIETEGKAATGEKKSGDYGILQHGVEERGQRQKRDAGERDGEGQDLEDERGEEGDDDDDEAVEQALLTEWTPGDIVGKVLAFIAQVSMLINAM